MDHWIESGESADYITLAGSGEPTLHAAFGRIIDFVHSTTDIPVALLTNSSLLIDPEVRVQAAGADVVKVSLSAGDSQTLDRVNRPHPAIGFDTLLEGVRRFREEYRGEMWVEVFLVPGMNDTDRQVAAVAAQVRTIRPDRIHLNTAVRPPCERHVSAVSREQMERIARLFTPVAEVIAEYHPDATRKTQTNETGIYHMLRRRPCTLEDLCLSFGLHRNEVLKYLGKLRRTGWIYRTRRGNVDYYSSHHESPEGKTE